MQNGRRDLVRSFGHDNNEVSISTVTLSQQTGNHPNAKWCQCFRTTKASKKQQVSLLWSGTSCLPMKSQLASTSKRGRDQWHTWDGGHLTCICFTDHRSCINHNFGGLRETSGGRSRQRSFTGIGHQIIKIKPIWPSHLCYIISISGKTTFSYCTLGLWWGNRNHTSQTSLKHCMAIHLTLVDVIIHPSPNFKASLVEVGAWMWI